MKEKLIKITATAFLITSTVANAGWSISTLGTLEGLQSTASGINNSGQIIGGYRAEDGTSRTFITGPNGTGITEIGTLGGSYSVATAINDSGQVAGYSQLSNPLQIHAFVTGPNGTGMTDLGAINKFSSCEFDDGSCSGFKEDSRASAINKSGQVVGRDGTDYPDFIMDGFITKPDGTAIVSLNTIYSHYLPAIGSYRFTSANGINDSGQVTGIAASSLPGYDSYIFITGADGIGMTFIDGLGSNYKEANSINNLGQVAGTYYPNGSSEAHSFITGPNGIGIIDIGTLGGFSRALDINDFGQVIGMSFNSSGAYHSYLFNDGEMIDLSILPEILNTGWTDLRVSAINNSGEIVGSGKFDGITQAFLLSPLPVPEPATYAMLLAGFGLMWLANRRNKII
jgi:probable HAF family extracellular repeat protein